MHQKRVSPGVAPWARKISSEQKERDLHTPNRPVDPVKDLAAALGVWLSGLSDTNPITCRCPVEQYDGIEPHTITMRHDLHRGLVIKCHDGHSQQDVLRALVRLMAANERRKAVAS